MKTLNNKRLTIKSARVWPGSPKPKNDSLVSSGENMCPLFNISYNHRTVLPTPFWRFIGAEGSCYFLFYSCFFFFFPAISNLYNLCFLGSLERRYFYSVNPLLLGEGDGNPLQYSCLENSMMKEPGRLQSMESQRVRHNWATSLIHSILFYFCRQSRSLKAKPFCLVIPENF